MGKTQRPVCGIYQGANKILINKENIACAG